jgi:hypothetical protein
MLCSRRSSGAIMDVVVWLRSLGLGQYEAAFRQNEIDETVLPSLTAEDLEFLRVSIVGHVEPFVTHDWPTPLKYRKQPSRRADAPEAA